LQLQKSPSAAAEPSSTDRSNALAKIQAQHSRYVSELIQFFNGVLEKITVQFPSEIEASMMSGSRTDAAFMSHECFIALGDLSEFLQQIIMCSFTDLWFS
jgi:hypothetical protein